MSWQVKKNRAPTVTTPEQAVKVMSTKTFGNVSFKLVPSLSWPPLVQTQMHYHRSKETSDAVFIRITALNIGDETVSVQTRGRPRFYYPKGVCGYTAMGIEGDLEDPRPRIIDRDAPAATSNLQVWDVATGEIVRQKRRPRVCGLYDPAKHDPRPKLVSPETLRPGQPLERIIDISRVLKGLPDGRYSVRLERRGLWWCPGAVDDFAVEGDDHVPRDLFKTNIPPLVLECNDPVDIIILNGQVSEADHTEAK